MGSNSPKWGMISYPKRYDNVPKRIKNKLNIILLLIEKELY